MDGNRKLVLLADDNLLAEKDKLIETLAKQVEHLQALLNETNAARERSNTIVLSLTQQVNSQNRFMK